MADDVTLDDPLVSGDGTLDGPVDPDGVTLDDPLVREDGTLDGPIVPDEATLDGPIVPDDKDWTWVLRRPCPECGVDVSTVAREDVAERIRANAREWVAVLGADPAALRQRPRADRWSTLEYAAHVRDVFVLFRERLGLMMSTDDPLYPNWDQDETAVAERYDEQDPAAVSADLLAAGEALAADLDAVVGDGWQRPGRRSDGASFTVESFARYLLHDPLHHLWDVTAA